MIPQARLVLSLLEKKKTREKEGLFVIEGEKLVEEGLPYAKFILYSQNLPIVLKAQAQNVPTFQVSRVVMEKISSVETPPGVIGVARIRNWNIENAVKEKNPLVLFAVEIQDPGNLGTMIRVADAVKASGIIVSKGTADQYSPKVVRSTMGSIFRVPIAQSPNISDSIGTLKKLNIKIVGTDINAKKYHWDADLSGPTAILIGNESAGLSQEDLNNCTETVKIPMPGGAESLNAAQAATLILYEALRQRMKNV